MSPASTAPLDYRFQQALRARQAMEAFSGRTEIESTAAGWVAWRNSVLLSKELDAVHPNILSRSSDRIFGSLSSNEQPSCQNGTVVIDHW